METLVSYFLIWCLEARNEHFVNYLYRCTVHSVVYLINTPISMAIYVRGTYRQTQLFYWLIIVRVYNNMFRPYSWAIIRLYHDLE